MIGFIGLPGSGKGEASKIAGQHGLAVVVMGDVIRQEAARLGLDPTDQVLGYIGSALRAEEGPDAVAKRTLKMAIATGKDLVIVDGLRSKEEADFLRAHAEQFHLVEVCAPAETRLKRLEARGRPDDPGSAKSGAKETDPGISPSRLETDRPAAAALEQRERRELGWGMCEAMKSADMKLRNDGSLDDLRKNVKRLLSVLEAGAAHNEE